MSYQGGILDFQPSVQTAGIQVGGGVDWQIMFLPWQGFKYHIQIKRFDNRQISDNKY